MHRLDAPTSGLLLFGKTLPAARSLARQFKMRQLQKQCRQRTRPPAPLLPPRPCTRATAPAPLLHPLTRYLAALLGSCDEACFEVGVPIARHPKVKTLSVVVPPQAGSAHQEEEEAEGQEEEAEAEAGRGAKHALTNFEVLARSSGATLVAARPLTGRMHQIRVHADYAGHPIAGDPQYGHERQAEAGALAACGRLMLHAHTLQITHPEARQPVRFTAAPTADFCAALRALGIDEAASAEVASLEGATWLDDEEEDVAEGLWVG